MLALYTLIIFLGLSVIGFPVAISLGLAACFFAASMNIPFSILAQTLFTSIDNFSYIAIPLFILVGNLMESGGLSRRLVSFAVSFLKKIPGSLGTIMIASCTFFGAISGSASATTASIGGMIVPEMNKRNYPKGYSGALAAVAGTLGEMIPPSIIMIIYAVTAEVSVADMFLAGFLPGILIAAGLAIANSVYTAINHIDIVDKNERISLKEVGSTFWDAKWALLTPVIILGGIYTGVFTATECAVIATLYALAVGFFIYKELTWKTFLEACARTCRTVGAVLIVVPMAIALARLLTISQTPQQIGNWILGITDNANVIMLLLVGLVFIAGMFIDSAPIVLILTPLFLPILSGMGVSPIHFGIVVTMGCMIANVTPPVGVSLFVAQGIADVDSLTIMKYAAGLIAVFMVLYVIILFNPWISLSLLTLLKG